jgi:hypothetical protein
MRLEWTFVVGALLAGLDGLIQLLVRAIQEPPIDVSTAEHYHSCDIFEVESIQNGRVNNQGTEQKDYLTDCHALHSAPARARRQGPTVLDRPGKRQRIIERIAA